MLGPTFAPLLGSLGKAAAIWFIMFNMFHGTLQPLAGAARTLSQLADDGLLPRFLSLRYKPTDCPWAATALTAGCAIVFLIMGDPVWMIAAANFTYLIGICMPNIAAWLLRRDMPDAVRPYRAPRGTITLGVIAAAIWLIAAILGFQQFGLPTVVFGLALAYSGAALYAWRVIEDRIAAGLPAIAQTLHVKLTGAMVLVLVLDGIAYLVAVHTIAGRAQRAGRGARRYLRRRRAAHHQRRSGAARHDHLLGDRGEQGRQAPDHRHLAAVLQRHGGARPRRSRRAPTPRSNIVPVKPNSRDELGEMADSFNVLQEEVRKAALSLGEARDKMQVARAELLARHEEIAFLAHHDALTNLANRPALSLQLARTLEQAKANGRGFAVLSVDLDHFKEANDVFGHVIGDELLCAIARRLENAAGHDFIARVGGDEFVILSSGGEQPQTAAQLADRVLKSVEEEFSVREQKIQIGLSIGAAIYPSDGSDTQALLANADAALYRAKLDGRQTVRFFDPEMDKRLRERYALQHDLRSAIAHGELALHYQPQAKIDGEVFGFEALLRWQHPKHGFIPPNTFIPLAEQNGMIGEIGEWTLRAACREAASWASPMQIGINLSPVQFRHGDLPGLVHSILLETGLAPGRLELEITEGVLIGDPQRALSILRRLKLLGVKIAMDDFGTGYASLSSLQSFPFDKIKIDRTFVMGVDHNGQSQAIVRAVMGLGKALNIPVIAEGVETEGERLLLMREGCPEIQGYLIGYPRPIESYKDLTSGAVTQRALAG